MTAAVAASYDLPTTGLRIRDSASRTRYFGKDATAVIAPRYLIPVAAAAALLGAAAPASARQAAAPAKTGPVAVIDMAKVFANYDKFEDVRHRLSEEIKAEGARAEALADKIQSLQAVLQSGNISQESEEYLTKTVELKNTQTE
ncbi:MAG: hypothetical protein AAF907_11345, partial [Planctomycetota bacterium]